MYVNAGLRLYKAAANVMDVKFKLARYKLWYIDPLKKKQFTIFFMINAIMSMNISEFFSDLRQGVTGLKYKTEKTLIDS